MVTTQRTKELCQTVRLKSTQVFIVAGTCLVTLLVTLVCIGLMTRYEVQNEVANVADVDYWKDKVAPSQKIWYDRGIEELNEALRSPSGPIYPKNVRIFLVQGVDGRDLAAYRFSATDFSQGNTNFVWDQFPHLARLKNSCSQQIPCEVARVSKAFWAGIPLESVPRFQPDCGHLANATDNVLSVLRQAQLVGLRTGFVTTQRITGATAAALGNTNSNYECDERMPLGSSKSGCLDIARQLISGQTGRSLNVIIGGGRQMLNSVVPKTRSDPVDELLCESSDGRNLLKEWRSHKLRQSKISPIKFELVQRTDELESLNASNFDFLLGVMANGDLSGNAKAPSLKLMVERSLQVLKKQDQGYLLIVEQFIQSGMDKRKQLLLLNETLVDLHTDQDTLTLVLMTNAIYPKPILDVSEETETISHLSDSFNEPEFQIQQRLHQMPSESLLFARGPKSSIFHGVRKESFLAHAVSHVLSRSIAIP
ncbi:alkaline phosphatase 4 [Drosophila gunungcola]|uniref:alkaline phosphatase 4 n=1 Tax=Drosophila gunungcola TaxID=103775 RepID=UPI0022E24D4F|nr:alkaline phosphatase 4 [Drosophila gunungcola]XP_052836230.1 alkaline phosphatase 4 [Drosophila gunungcola]XP_052836231.1 alkaline phosphatase 4 [Drosophila gunungcola]XP_052836232.1 alkaline phosphatase 4 [Drosophila gunungcola]